MTSTSLLRLNPELQRCLWLELTPNRLILMPVLLGLALSGLHMTRVDNLSEWVLYLLYGLLVLWGTRLAADSFVEEVTQGTWDIQRLSASNPWAMAWGKLLGGTAYVWYGALWLLLAVPFLPGSVGAGRLALALVGGLTAQATALLVVLGLHRFDASRKRGSTTLAQVLGILASFAALGQSSALTRLGAEWGSTVDWYGASLPAMPFSLVSQIIALAWLFLAVAWLIRLQLGHAPSPWPFMSFSVYHAVYGIGFMLADVVRPTIAQILGGTALILAVCVYIGLLGAPLYASDIKRLLRADTWPRRWDLLPGWVPVAALAVLLGLGTVASGGSDWTLAAGVLAIFIRDVGLIATIRLSGHHRTHLLLVVLGVLLYWLLPEVLNVAGGGALRAFVLPSQGMGAASLLGPWVQALGALTLAWLAWMRHRGA